MELKIEKILMCVANKAKSDKTSGCAWSDRRWTSEIINGLVILGKNNGYEASARQCNEANCGEWLFDLAWYKYNKNRQLENLYLAMESEWGNKDAIRFDFEKLLVARAKYRLLIFQGIKIQEILVDLKQRINIFESRQKGDRYLFAGWDKKKQQFIIDNYVV